MVASRERQHGERVARLGKYQMRILPAAAVYGGNAYKERAKQPSRFEFELLIDEVIYAFSYAVTREKVLEERLVKVASTSERILYDRRGGKIEFDESVKEELQFLRFAFQGTRDNQLFLTNTVSQKVQHLWKTQSTTNS